MTLQEIIKKKLTDYSEKYGFEAGFELLRVELEADMWTVKVILMLNFFNGSD